MAKFFQSTKNLFTGESKSRHITDASQILELMNTTRDELSRIERNYEEVTDDDLLDYFMYCRLATQQKYNYLIKQYRLITACPEQECM